MPYKKKKKTARTFRTVVSRTIGGRSLCSRSSAHSRLLACRGYTLRQQCISWPSEAWRLESVAQGPLLCRTQGLGHTRILRQAYHPHHSELAGTSCAPDARKIGIRGNQDLVRSSYTRRICNTGALFVSRLAGAVSVLSVEPCVQLWRIRNRQSIIKQLLQLVSKGFPI